MSLPSENEFEEVRRLLVVKRHEVPPPGYFDRLPDRVMARLEREDAAGAGSWWERWVRQFEVRPIVACVYGLAVSGLLLTGFRVAQAFENEAVQAGVPAPGNWLAISSSPVPMMPLSDGENAGGGAEPTREMFGMPIRSALAPQSAGFAYPHGSLRVQRVSYPAR